MFHPVQEVNLIFTYTLASDPNANEISSSSQGAVVTFGTLGDVNSDTFINVVDIVNIVNFALQIEIPTEFEFWSSDLNQDGNINILDIVSVINMILYGSDMQRSDSQNATVYYNEKEIHIHGKDIAGFQIEFLDHFEINNIVIPDSWLFDINKKTIIVYNIDGMLLNDKSILKLDKENSITNIIISNAQGNAMTVNLGSIPHSVHLNENYPNPFNPQTTISYNLFDKIKVNLSIYDLSGRIIETLVDERQSPGNFSIAWDASELPSGIYIARLNTENQSLTKKMILMK